MNTNSRRPSQHYKKQPALRELKSPAARLSSKKPHLVDCKNLVEIATEYDGDLVATLNAVYQLTRDPRALAARTEISALVSVAWNDHDFSVDEKIGMVFGRICYVSNGAGGVRERVETENYPRVKNPSHPRAAAGYIVTTCRHAICDTLKKLQKAPVLGGDLIESHPDPVPNRASASVEFRDAEEYILAEVETENYKMVPLAKDILWQTARNQRELAKKHQVNQSTVSRLIKRMREIGNRISAPIP